MDILSKRTFLKSAAVGLLAATALSGQAWAQSVTITYLVDNTPTTVATAEAHVAAFEAAHPDINVELETRPGGTEGDNLVKTMLAVGEMADVFSYNSGSLFQALNPSQNLVDMTNEPWQANVLDSFKQVVTAPDGTVRGAPHGTAMGGGILYNIPIYEELGLEVPKSWDEFMANNKAIADAGHTPVIQTFGATWTSQLFVLGDYFNVQAEEPDFATRYTNNEAKYATSEAAMRGFQYQAEIYDAGYLNEDFAVATFEEGVARVATGGGAHYPMLTFAIANIEQLAPGHTDDVGFFAIPGPSSDVNGLTTWMPNGLYIPQTTDQLDAAKTFVAFVASTEGCQIEIETVGAAGPFLIQGCTLPDSIPPAVADLQSYFTQQGTTAPALEFVSPIKGPNLENLTVEVGSGIRDPKEAAELYDEDVRKQAQQLGLEGW